MNAIESLREGFDWAVELLEITMADVTEEQARAVPMGIANPLGATYAHAVSSLDAIVQVLLKGEKPLFETEWTGKTGISQPQWVSTSEWARMVTTDLGGVKEYAQAAYANARAYLSNIQESDLERERDLSSFGLGMRSVNWILQALVTGHLHDMTGEISVLKGIQGAKGYPF